MRTLFAVTTLSLLALTTTTGCDPVYVYNGYTLPPYFPLDGSVREWEYASTDSAVEGGLRVEKADAMVQDEVEVVTLEYWNVGVDETEDLAWSVDWSTDDVQGVRIHRYLEEASGTEVTFDPPVQFMGRDGVTGDQVVTSSGGFTWTATFEAVDGCGTYWVPDWDDQDCLVINLDDGDGDPSTNSVIVGTYWLVTRWGAALMELDAYDTRWSLADTKWES